MRTSFTGRDPSTGQCLVIHCSDGCIAAIEPCSFEDDCWIAPGLIDLQVNGYRGNDCNADDLAVKSVQDLARHLLAAGVTTFLPTIITASETKIIRNLRTIVTARETDPLVRRMIPRVHVEGPHISPEDGPRGAHPQQYVRAPDITEFLRWQEASGDLVGMVTLSPHYEAAATYTNELCARGIHVAIGHTQASAKQIRSAVDAGARLSTHLGNAVAQVLPRHPNLLWAQLAEDRLTATLIADGHHMPMDTLMVMLRAKTIDRAVLISDVVMLAGLPPGAYKTPIGGKVEMHADGRLNVAGTDYLAGSAILLKDAVAFVANLSGFSLADALRMATANPGRFAERPGVLQVGAPADLIRFQWAPGCSTLLIEEVVFAGRSWPGRF